MKIIKSFEDPEFYVLWWSYYNGGAPNCKYKWFWGLGSDGELWCKYKGSWSHYAGNCMPNMSSIVRIAKEFGHLLVFL
jgi:hypothetical protein